MFIVIPTAFIIPSVSTAFSVERVLTTVPTAMSTTDKRALSDLTAKTKKFTTLAKQLSDDTATKGKAGDLGWMSRARLPADFAESVFSLPKDSPTLVRTKLGWHLVIVTDRKGAKLRDLDECRQDIIDALTATKRHQAVSDFRSALRRFETAKIDIFHDLLEP